LKKILDSIQINPILPHEMSQPRRRAQEQKMAKKTKELAKEQALPATTARDRAAIKKYLARDAAKSSVRFKVSKSGDGTTIGPDHPNKSIGHVLLMDAFGSADGDFATGLVRQLAKASRHGEEVDESELNFMLAVIKGVAPKDQLEAMLATQMVAVHMASMTFAHRLNHVEIIPQQDSAERAFNKLTRTFAMQMDALKRYRTGAEQTVTNVSVSEGGQAVVGNVTQVPHGNVPEKAATSSATAFAGANVVPMPTVGESKERSLAAGRRTSVK
jgi:hypothetical protein